MAINLNNGIVNIQQTPGAITDIYANIPSANGVAVGTLFISTDTGAIYSSDGTNWLSVSGGGGSQDLQSVTDIGSTTTNQIYVTDNTNYTSVLGIATIKNAFYNGTDNIFWYCNPNKFGFYDLGNSKEVFFEWDYNNELLFTQGGGYSCGIYFDFYNYTFTIGDYGGSIKGDYLIIDNTNEFIKTFMSGNEFGLFIDRTFNVYLGDWLGSYNGTFIQIDDVNQAFKLSSNLLVGTSGSNSGQHLKVNVGGTDYVIQLLNP